MVVVNDGCVVVISLDCAVVLCVVIMAEVVSAVVFLFLSLPQAKSAKTSARKANIARIFFIAFSLFGCAKLNL